MIVLALDTCDSRGSVAILRDDRVLHSVAHDSDLDYSSWILPSADSALVATDLNLRSIDVLAVASGPGSFTGLRVGLTTVKAWSEVYGTPIAAVPRLEAIAAQATGQAEYVGAFFDAQRQQIFAALYRRQDSALKLIEKESVIPPEEFLNFVDQHTHEHAVSWVSLDPEKISSLSGWTRRSKRGEQIQLSKPPLAPIIGHLGRRLADEGRLKDALTLDAEYVRRSDAEIFWKVGVKRGA